MTNLFDHFAVLKPDMLLDELEVTPDFYERLDAGYDSFSQHVLISAHQFSEDWSTWEMHPHGDEVVVLMSGAATFLLKTSDGEQARELSRAGEYVVVPKSIWHTAKVDDAASMLFITPGEGTLNEETPPSID